MEASTDVGVIERQRLAEAIGTAVEDLSPLTLLCAQRGYGKTTLLQQWRDRFESTGVPVYGPVIPPDSSPSSLWKAIGTAVGAPQSTSDRQTQAEVWTWAQNLTEPAVLVIDEYERVVTGQTDESLVALLERSANLFLIVSARCVALLDGSLSRATVQTRLLTTSDLAFTETEAREVAAKLARHRGEDVSGEDAFGTGVPKVLAHGPLGDVGSDFRSWPLALRAVASSTEADDGQVLSALADSLFADATERDSKRLLFAVSRTGGAAIQTLITRLGLSSEAFARTLFEVMAAGFIAREPRPAGVWLTMPEAMRGVMARHTLAAHDDCTFDDFILDHADFLSATDPIAATRIYMSLDRMDRAEAAVIEHFDSFVPVGAQLSELLHDVPFDRITNYPVLLGIRLVEDYLGPDSPSSDTQRISEQILKAAAVSAGAQEAHPRAVIIQALLIVAERTQGRWEAALERARALESHLAGYANHGFQADNRGLPLVLAVIGLTGILAGDLDLAQRSARRALEVSESQGNGPEQVRAHCQLALLHCLLSEAQGTKEHLTSTASLVENGHAPGLGSAWVNCELAVGLDAIRRGDLPQANAALGKLLPAVDSVQQWPLVLMLQSYIGMYEDGPKHAFVTLQQALVEHPQLKRLSPNYQAVLQARLATLAVYVGNFAAAEAVLEKGDRGHPKVATAFARMRLFQRQFAEAQRLFTEIRSDISSKDLDADLVLIGALSAYGLGEKTEAAALLRLADILVVAAGEPRQFHGVPFNLLEETALYAQKNGIVDVVSAVSAIPVSRRLHSVESLSATEEATLRRLRSGMTMASIAADMRVSHNTVKFHRSNIYRKLGVSNKYDAMRKATQMGLLGDEE